MVKGWNCLVGNQLASIGDNGRQNCGADHQNEGADKVCQCGTKSTNALINFLLAGHKLQILQQYRRRWKEKENQKEQQWKANFAQGNELGVNSNVEPVDVIRIRCIGDNGAWSYQVKRVGACEGRQTKARKCFALLLFEMLVNSERN